MRLGLSIIIFLPLFTLAQSRVEVDSLTYIQFTNKDYKALVQTGEAAIQRGIDFFYLRMRIGILAYEQKRYVRASEHFGAALEMNPSDTLAQEYLYYTYVFSGQEEQARSLSLDFSSSMKERLGIKRKSIDYVALNFGYLSNTVIEDNKDRVYITMKGTASESKLNGNLSLGDFSSKFWIRNRMSVTGNVSFFRNEALLHAQVDTLVYKFKAENFNYQGNLIVQYQFRNNWKISLGTALFYYNYHTLKETNGTPITPPTYSVTEQNSTAILGTFRLERNEKYLRPFAGISYSNLALTNQVQVDLGTSYYPFGNYSIYGKTAFTLMKHDSIAQKVFVQTLGFKLSRNTWLEGSFMTGNLRNMITQNGLLTFNTPDPVKLSVGGDLIIRLKKLTLVPSYRFQERVYGTTVRRPPPFGNQVIKTDYANHIFNISIKWNF